MADTTRKKSSSVDQSHASKDKGKGIEKGIHSKQIIKGPKPPLPPRPVGLSKPHPGKKKISVLSRSPEQPKETKNKTEANQGEGYMSSKPRHPPLPLPKGDMGEEAKTNEVGNVSTLQYLANDSTSKDGSAQQGSGLDTSEIPNTSAESKIDCIPQVVDSNLEQLETSCVSKQSEELHQMETPVNTNTEHLETADNELSQEPCLENTTEQKILVEAKVTHQKPTRPENPKSVNTEGISEDDPKRLPKIPEPCSKPSSKTSKTISTDSKTVSMTGKTPQTPERPKPPNIARTPSVTAISVEKSNFLDSNSKSQDKMRSAATPEKPKPPKFHKAPKVAPPVPPKPDSPHAERKCKSNTPLNKLEKPSPPVQGRTPKSKPPMRPKGPEVARSSEIVKENDVKIEKTGSFDVDIPCDDEIASYSVGKTSSTAEITPQTNEEIGAIPGTNGINEERELSLQKNLPSNVNTASEDAKPVPHEEKPDNPVRSKTSKEKTFETSNTESRKDVKPSRPRAPSRKTENIVGEKISENHDDSALPEKQKIPVKPTVNLQSGENITHVTEDIQIATSENKIETRALPKPSRPSKPKLSHDHSPLPNDQDIPKKDIKPSRPHAPPRKTVNLVDEKILESHDNSPRPDNQTLTIKPAVDEQSCEVFTDVFQDPPIDTSENNKTVASSRPSRPSEPKLSHDNLSFSDNQNSSLKPMEDQQSSEVITHVTEDVQITPSEKNKTKTVAPARPSRPSKPKQIRNNTDNQNIHVKPTVDEQSCDVISHVTDDVQMTTSKVNKTETEAPARPFRPTKPKLSRDNSSLTDSPNIPVKPTVDEQSCEVIAHVTEDVQMTTSKVNKTETEAPARPSRPTKPKLSRDNSSLTDSPNIPLKPTVDEQSSEVITHVTEDVEVDTSKNNKTKTVPSPRPSRPSRSKLSHDNPDDQNIPGKPTACQQSDEVFTHVTEDDTIATSGNNTETVASPRLSRPSKPKYPPELSKTSKSVETNTSGNANEHGKSLKQKGVDKPQRPLQPKLSNEPAVRMESHDSSKGSPQGKERKPSVVIDHVPKKTDASVKPQRPSKPKLPSEFTAAEETKINELQGNNSNDDLEALQHKNVTPEKPSRPARPNEIIASHKQTMTSEKNESDNPSIKKPCRPPQPITHDTSYISPVKSQTSKEETTKLTRPPRPQVPHSGHEKNKQISADKEICVETPPPKPQRTSMSEHVNLDLAQSEPEKEESISGQPIGEAKLEKISQNAEENKECLNESIVDEPGKVIVVKENDNDSKEICNGEQGQCETTRNNMSAKDYSELAQATLEHSKSFKLSSPPATSRTNCSQKEETQNAPHFKVRRRSKDQQETTASDMDKSSEQRTFRFRVSSLTKTEVESFNKKDFLEKLKNEKGPSRRNSEEESKSSQPPVLQPKPSRLPPQPSHEKTQIIDKGKHEEKVEGHGTESCDVVASDITFKTPGTVAGMGPGEEKNIPVKDSCVSEALVSEHKVSDVVSSEKTNTKLPERKIKRKAPPEPRKTEEQHKYEEHLGNEGSARNEQKMNSKDRRNTETIKLDVKRGEGELTEGLVVVGVEKKSGVSSTSEQATVGCVEKNGNRKDSSTQDLNDEQVKNEGKIRNNVTKQETATTNERQMVSQDNDVCLEPIVVAMPVEIGTSVDEEVPVVTEVSLVSESVPLDESVSRGEVTCTDKQVNKLQGCETTTNKHENTFISHEPACNEPSVSSKDSQPKIPSNSGKSSTIVNVETPKKKKDPPPKPKRTSSLKRDSKPIVPKNEVSKESQRELAETEDERTSSPESMTKISEEKEAGNQIGTTKVVSNTIPKGPIVPPAKAVGFDERTPATSSKPSKPVSRSTSFAPPGKIQTNTTGAVNKDIARLAGEGISRSHSFGAKIRSINQPPRPRPPTFYLDDTKDKESAVKDPKVETGLVSEEHSDDVNKVEYISSSQEDLVESGTSQNDNNHDSLLTTDSDSENEKGDEPQKSKTYYISREILSTERTFVDVVKLVSEDFREAVNEGKKRFGRAIIPDETLHDIVLNISQIYEFDREFLKALEDRMETWDEEQRIGDIIKKFSPFLKMYKTYIQGYDNAMAVLSDALKKHPQFAEVVREFECSERCQNLTVGMYMLKPIQRIPSYRLLLKDYLKHLSKDSLDYKDVSDALDIVSDVATHINEDMKRVDNFEEVLKVQRSLVGQVEIVKPGRELIKEGALMKLCRKDMQPRMFYLLTDVLLYTTPVANNQFRLNLSLPLEEIKVEIPVSPDFDNEFSIISTKKSFTLSASTAEERDEWLEALRNASDEIRKKKITFHLAKKEKMDALFDAQTDDDNEAKLGSKAPVWIPDIRVSMCMICTDDFTVTNRRHHCRACGKVICGSCSSNSAPLAYLNYETARVCDVCYDALTADKTSSTQTGVEAKENGISSEKKEPAPKINPVKKKKTQKFKSKEVPAVEESNISGYLKTRVGKKWHRRWYVVKDNVLFASKASSDVAAQETRPLLGYDVRGPDKMDGDSKKIVFQLIHAGTEPVVLQTDNMKSAERWVTALRRATILPRE